MGNINLIDSMINDGLTDSFSKKHMGEITNDVNKYGILANDKCMSVSGTCANGGPFCMQECQKGLYTTDSQKFYTNRIYSAADS